MTQYCPTQIKYPFSFNNSISVNEPGHIYIYPDSSYYHLIFLSFFLKKQQICPAFAKLSQIKKGQGDERIRDCTSCATIQNKRGAQKEEDGILALGPKCHAKSISFYPVAPKFLKLLFISESEIFQASKSTNEWNHIILHHCSLFPWRFVDMKRTWWRPCVWNRNQYPFSMLRDFTSEMIDAQEKEEHNSVFHGFGQRNCARYL